jgi:stalled ribosome rescue protein Dom34
VNHSAEAQATHTHAVIWVDHLTAKIFAMGLTGVTPSVVHAHLASSHLHHKANTIGSGKVAEDQAFLAQIAKAVEPCTEVLIVGPGIEKVSVMHHLQAAYPQMVLRQESADHPSDGEIIALGRKHFRLDERI